MDKTAYEMLISDCSSDVCSSALLQDCLTNLAEAFRAQAMRPEASAAVGRIYGALKTPRPAGAAVPRRRPVCRHLAEALATARSGSAPVARVDRKSTRLNSSH